MLRPEIFAWTFFMPTTAVLRSDVPLPWLVLPRGGAPVAVNGIGRPGHGHGATTTHRTKS